MSPQASDYPIRPVPFTAVHIHDAFWSPRIETNRTVTIPYAFQKCEETGRVALFERAAAALRNEPNRDKTIPGYPFDDTDIYKILEGASYSLSVHPDPKLDAYLDSIITKIAAAQEPDGYLYPARTINPEHPHAWSGNARWVNEKVLSHELYDLGHLYEAAAAQYQATGKRSLLDIALKSANLLDQTFGPEKSSTWPGHQIVEMGLVKLTRITGDPKYLNLAKFFLDQRGPDGSKGVGEYNQSWKPVTQQSIATGHAVRATYMYSGMADVAALTGDSAYLSAIDRIWNNCVSAKIYITGGIGARPGGEAFGADYELPNRTAYNETCASIGNDYWNQRLFLLHGDAKYIDVLERTLYNSLLSGVSLQGTSFFYPNPLESGGEHERSAWFGCACCPGNVTRFLASVPGYLYAQKDDTIFVNLYADSTANLTLPGIDNNDVTITQTTQYPWDGKIKLTFATQRPRTFTAKLRIPGWSRNEPIPSSLYKYTDTDTPPITLTINGESAPLTLTDGYATLTREWKPTDIVELNLPMPIRRVVASDNVKPDRNKITLQRGPIVYCAEHPDNGGHTLNLALPDAAPLTAEYRKDFLGGVTVLTGKALSSKIAANDQPVTSEQDFLAIPYSVWANRGPGEMSVWLPRDISSVTPLPKPTLISTAKLSTSQGKHLLPRRFDFWPAKGTKEYVDIELEFPSEASHFEVTWFTDEGQGECHLPQSWSLLYREGDTWKPVQSSTPTSLPSGTGNRRPPSKLDFAPVTTQSFRLEIQSQPDWSSGVQSMVLR